MICSRVAATCSVNFAGASDADETWLTMQVPHGHVDSGLQVLLANAGVLPVLFGHMS